MTETTAITAATPMMMPSVVRMLRNACARMAARAAVKLSSRLNMPGLFPLSGLIAFHPPVSEPHDAVGVLGDFCLVGDDHDCVAVFVKRVKQLHDLGARG